MVQTALRGEHGTSDGVNLAGNEAIIAHDFIEFAGVRWAMIAKTARDEILAPVGILALRLLAMTLVALAGLAIPG
ncbi:MAG: hypothetical protein AAF543_05235 [Pseudomonadota bacterium]